MRVAVVGADRDGRGFGARAHLPGALGAPGVEVTAVCTAHQETARLAAERYGIPRAYWNIDELVRDPEVDLITIATRVRSHLPLAWAALQAGKMVYCEWPLGLDAGEGRLLADLAGRTHTLTAVGTQGRFAPGMLYLKDLVTRGEIGRPLFFHLTHLLPRFAVRSDHWWSATEEEHSGALGVATAHATDALQAVLGPIEAISGYAETLHPHDRYSDTAEPFQWTAMDTVSYQARLRSGVTGTAHISNLATHQIGFQLDVFGEGAHIAARAPVYVSYSPITLALVRKDEPAPRVLTIPREYFQAGGLTEENPGHNIAQALAAFRRAWLSGEPFHPSFEDGYRLHQLIGAIRRSWRDRAWISLRERTPG